jgi:hypothetical protein
MGPGRRGRRTPVESIVMGLAMGGALVAWWVLAPGGRASWWMLPAALVMGIMPVARGISGIVAQRSAITREREAKRLADGGEPRAKGRGGAAWAERTILRLASERGGRLTPSLVVLGSDMTIEEAERALDELAKKGHAALRVRDDGRVEYEFSEFLPQSGVAN